MKVCLMVGRIIIEEETMRKKKERVRRRRGGGEEKETEIAPKKEVFGGRVSPEGPPNGMEEETSCEDGENGHGKLSKEGPEGNVQENNRPKPIISNSEEEIRDTEEGLHLDEEWICASNTTDFTDNKKKKFKSSKGKTSILGGEELLCLQTESDFSSGNLEFWTTMRA
ncbi:hypothetical protein L6452_08120 [Arctium lappa]|uniref:Uncharacterized protein n=1 Tax=Arctium lappa TaxID=4217 RepID=A0ACB9DGE2_ARCLA|nr:hypothetical protein L6452_08120 [Arctium lappa]